MSTQHTRSSGSEFTQAEEAFYRSRAVRVHLSDWLRVRDLEVSDRQLGLCRFLQTVMRTGPRLLRVCVLRWFCRIQLGALLALHPLGFRVLWRFGALLLCSFASVHILVLLERQQIGLLLLQLPLKLLGLALLL